MGDADSNYAAVSRHNDRIKLNVGGKLFETTVDTLRSGGPESLLSVLSSRPSNENPVFIDRDPEIFSVLLSLLRSDHLPSTSRRFSKQELADEALYYGIESRLKSAISPPLFKGIDASVVATIRPAADGLPSAYCAGAGDGSVMIAHGGQISNYDWNLAHADTIRTHLDEISSIHRVWQEVAAVGSENAPGLHFYDVTGGKHLGSTYWTDPVDPRIYKARVYAIADSDSSVFASFECAHKANCILMIDKTTLKVESEIGIQNGNSSKAIVADKLTFLPESSMLVGSAITSGAFGYSGYIRIWDSRSGGVVWETNEPGSGRSSRFGDSFADVTVNVDESSLFKICSKSGDIATADMRKLGDDPWVYLKDKNPSMRNRGGAMSNLIHCYNKQVFVGRDGGLEVWSRVEGGESQGLEREAMFCEGSYRRNYMDRVEGSERGFIRKIEAGGDRLFVSREDVEGIEVWESSDFASAVSVL